MNIYFSGSIRGGRGDTGLYADIVSILRNHGTVLTEHVANPDLSSYGKLTMTNEEIYEKDMAMLHDSDIVVAEVTITSLGVGYEIGAAEALGIPIVCLHRPTDEQSLSAMLVGNPHVRCIAYEQVEELSEIFKKIFYD